MHLYDSLVHADELLHLLCLLIFDGSCCCQVLFYLFSRPVILHNASALALHKPLIHGPAWFPGRANYVFCMSCLVRPDNSVPDGRLLTRCCDHLMHAYFALGVGLSLSAALCTLTPYPCSRPMPALAANGAFNGNPPWL